MSTTCACSLVLLMQLPPTASHAPVLMLERWGLFKLWPILEGSNSHQAELKCFKVLRLNSKPNTLHVQNAMILI